MQTNTDRTTTRTQASPTQGGRPQSQQEARRTSKLAIEELEERATPGVVWGG